MRDDMISGLFGALTCENRMNIIANNLANANTTGYKPERLAFEDVFVSYAHDEIRQPVLSVREKELFPRATNLSKVRIAGVRTDFSQGSLKNSDNPLDVAIQGTGFFKVQSEEGLLYTRNGNFHTTADGTLVNSDGYEVQGDGGAIVIPPNTRVDINEQGMVYADGDLVGQLQVVDVNDPGGSLEKYGRNLFRPKQDGAGGVVEQPSEDSVVVQGFLEMANVNIVEDMVNMIETQRAFEAYAKVLTTSNETCTKNITKVGKSTT
ncbi:flagellar basal-body rod protein FlgF [Megalodesulfovibrio paquesii]